jgi:hypothetical protein
MELNETIRLPKKIKILNFKKKLFSKITYYNIAILGFKKILLFFCLWNLESLFYVANHP